MSETQERLKALFKKIRVPDEIAEAQIPQYEMSPILEDFDQQMQDRRVRPKHPVIIEVPDEQDLLENLRKKLDFVDRYGAGTATPPPPYTMRLAYEGFCGRWFTASTKTNFVFNLFDCVQKLLDDWNINNKPTSIELFVYRNGWVRDQYNKRNFKPKGSWIKMMDFKIQERPPYFSFEELELAHEEIWPWIREYARRSIKPCFQLPLVDQNVGSFVPKQ